MQNIFPEPIQNLPKADIPLEGVTAFLSQAKTHWVTYLPRGTRSIMVTSGEDRNRIGGPQVPEPLLI